MTELLKIALEATQKLPKDQQDEIARAMLAALAGDNLTIVELSREDEASMAESLAQAERGEFASDEEVAAVWAKHGL